MNKREYMRANTEWLAEKAKEEGVIALPRGIYYKVLAEGNNEGRHPSPQASLLHTIRARLSTEKSLIAAEVALRWPCVSATLSTDGL